MNWMVSLPLTQWPAVTRLLSRFQTDAVHPWGTRRPVHGSLEGTRLSSMQMPHCAAPPATAPRSGPAATCVMTRRLAAVTGLANSSTMTVSPLKYAVL